MQVRSCRPACFAYMANHRPFCDGLPLFYNHLVHMSIDRSEPMTVIYHHRLAREEHIWMHKHNDTIGDRFYRCPKWGSNIYSNVRSAGVSI